MAMTADHPAPDKPSGYAELTREIRRRGLLGRRRGFYTGLFTTNLTGLVMVIVGMMLLRDTWWLMLLAAAFAVVSAQIA